MEVAERKLATVLFADLVGSTALCERQDEALLRDAIERFEAFGLGFHAEQTRLILQA